MYKGCINKQYHYQLLHKAAENSSVCINMFKLKHTIFEFLTFDQSIRGSYMYIFYLCF